MILCHTPFRAEELVQKYGSKYVLVSGLGKMLHLSNLYGYKKAIDIEELFTLYPQISPVTKSQVSKSYIEEKKGEVLQRLNITEDKLKAEMKFAAIFLWSDAVNLELNLQVMSDLLMSKDGSLTGPQRKP